MFVYLIGDAKTNTNYQWKLILKTGAHWNVKSNGVADDEVIKFKGEKGPPPFLPLFLRCNSATLDR